MEWKKISLQLPREISTLYKHIQKIQKNSCIAGGFLSDLYMKKPYQDIDIFIKKHDKKQQAIDCLMRQLGFQKMNQEGEDNHYDFSFSVHTYQKKKWKIQLIFTNLGIKHVKYFDFRFREFFYFNNTCYATPEALHDIKQKQLIFGVSIFPIKTLYRGLKFQKRYGFSYDEKNKDTFAYLFNTQRYTNTHLTTFLKNVKEYSLKETLHHLFAHKTQLTLPTSIKQGDIPDGLIEKINVFPLQRDLFEKALMPRTFTLIDSFPYPKEHVTLLTKQRHRMIKELDNELVKQRVRFVSIGKGDFYQKVKNKLNQEELTTLKEDLSSIHKEACNIEHDFINSFYYKLNNLKGFETSFHEISKHVHNQSSVKVFDKFLFLKVYQHSDLVHYAKGNLVIFDFHAIGSFVYNKKTKKIQYSTSYSLLHETMEEFLQSYYV
jgi:hypothetical protein